jgi:hypothetical protein
MITKEQFINIFDVAMICEIEKDKHKYRPYIAIVASGKLLKDINEYISYNIKGINVQYNKNSRRVFIRAIVNTKPILEHIIERLNYKKEIAEKLLEFVNYRNSLKIYGSRGAAYTETDLNYYKKMQELAGRGKWISE